jgi:drug/metabolite transporter (DMT)-like permease
LPGARGPDARLGYDALVSEGSASHHPLLGVGLKLASVFSFSSMAACVKYLGGAIPAGQVVFFRGALSLIVIAVVARYAGGLHLLKTQNWRAHAYRSVAGSLSMFCWFISLTLIPLAQMTTISFTIPLFLTVLALVFLGEHIRWYRWSALAVGFAGVLIIVSPDIATPGGSSLGVAIAMTAAVLAAFAQMFVRRMSAHEHALPITFYFFLTSSVLALATLAIQPWPWPSPGQWLVLCMVGGFGVLGQLTMTYSYRYAEASLVAPLDYVTILSAVALGYFVFGEVPRATLWLGAPLVMTAGAIILWRETAVLRRARRDKVCDLPQGS